MIYEIITRSQKSVGSGTNQFGGPDRYMVVVERPDGSEPVGGHPLSQANAKRFGWTMHGMGEYYAKSTGPRSAYARCLREANSYIAQQRSKVVAR